MPMPTPKRASSTATLLLLCSPVLGQAVAPAPGAANVRDCVRSLRDTSGGDCLEASSIPTMGKLSPYPGQLNTFTAPAVVCGGGASTASGEWSTVGGGFLHVASGRFSTIAGGDGNTASSFWCTVSGGLDNRATSYEATVGGGRENFALGDGTVVSGGRLNTASGRFAAIGGGRFSTAAGGESTVGGGYSNDSDGNYSTIGGGWSNWVSGPFGTIGGGQGNSAGGQSAAVGGGWLNAASGAHSTVPGGERNTASAPHSLAAGFRAKANHAGSFVWGDASSGDKLSSSANQFSVFASGGTRIFSNSTETAGVQLAPGAGSWSTLSDRSTKENVELVDGLEILEQLAAVPISTWNYRAQGEDIRHMGPMAQDFHAAFGLGAGERTIDTVDPDGVALAAIQGLREVTIAQAEEIAALRSRVEELESLRDRLAALEAELE